MDEDFLKKKLRDRQESGSFRQLRLDNGGIDFCSNDYLGITKNGLIEKRLPNYRKREKLFGSTGSRLISGNYALIEELEKTIAVFHRADAALVFNSGYDANLGLLSCILQRGDTVIYDYLSHASLRDGIRLSLARAFSFAHNDMDDLEKKLKSAEGRKFVVTESVFSMDGDLAPLAEISVLCERYNALLIVDEAHATGVMGSKGEGLVQFTGLEDKCFARVHTFGKALGCHGAAVLGSRVLKDYLVNFSRSFIYTTGMPASAVMAALTGYSLIGEMDKERRHIHMLVDIFRKKASGLRVCDSVTPIQAVVLPGNERVKVVAGFLQSEGLDVRPILYPTVPMGSERLRIVLHAFNNEADILKLVENIHSASRGSG